MIPANLYSTVFLYSIIILTILGFSTIRRDYNRIKQGANTCIPALLICIIFAIWLGMRPISGYYFGDTSNYARTYNLIKIGYIGKTDDGEWIYRLFWLYSMGL